MSSQIKIAEACCGEKVHILLVCKSVLAWWWLENMYNLSPILLDISMDKECPQSCKCELMVPKTCREERRFPKHQFSSRFSGAGAISSCFQQSWGWSYCRDQSFATMKVWDWKTHRNFFLGCWPKLISLSVDLLCDLLIFQFPSWSNSFCSAHPDLIGCAYSLGCDSAAEQKK